MTRTRIWSLSVFMMLLPSCQRPEEAVVDRVDFSRLMSHAGRDSRMWSSPPVASDGHPSSYAPAAGSASAEVHKLIAEAAAALRYREKERVRSACTEVLRLDPENRTARFWLRHVDRVGQCEARDDLADYSQIISHAGRERWIRITASAQSRR